MAVSSWNDNGQKQFVHDPYALYRSNFFPGLGWMLTRSIWNELSPKWPKAYWDDWLRLKENHKGRQFIRPEVCRTYNFGEHGSSMGQFFKQYLEPIKLNDVQVSTNISLTILSCSI
jgi:alpha-1,3-mannosyl-glycoprotein beta-1,2-N-acetylglucosaminyltransferase